VRVAVLGGTGSFGKALAAQLVAAGEHAVLIGSRDAERAQATAAELGGRATGHANDAACSGVDLVVLGNLLPGGNLHDVDAERLQLERAANQLPVADRFALGSVGERVAHLWRMLSVGRCGERARRIAIRRQGCRAGV